MFSHAEESLEPRVQGLLDLTVFVGRFNGKKVHWTFFLIRLTPIFRRRAYLYSKNLAKPQSGTLFEFAVGASPYDEKAIQQVRDMHFKNALSNIPSFYCRGAWDEEKMKFVDRTLCNMLQKAVAKHNPDEYEPWQKAMMCSVGQKGKGSIHDVLNLLSYLYS